MFTKGCKVHGMRIPHRRLILKGLKKKLAKNFDNKIFRMYVLATKIKILVRTNQQLE